MSIIKHVRRALLCLELADLTYILQAYFKTFNAAS